MKILKRLHLISVVVLTLVIASCGQTPAARFYTLSPLAGQADTGQKNLSGKQILAIGPVTVAAYLDRPEIVTRSSKTGIELAAFDRWAEPFEEIVANSLAENISRLLPGVQAIVDPWPEADVDYQLVVKIRKFESDAGGNIQLNASWGILQRASRKMGPVFDSNITLNGNSNEYKAITENMSLALVELSKEIASELAKISLRKL